VDSEFSPELALVCPDLAARARASLPDRPWEAFAARADTIVRIGPPPRVAREEPGRMWVERAANAFPIVMLVGLVALLIVGSLPGLSQGPTLGPLEPTTSLPQPSATAPQDCPAGAAC
jgi:hypothetical protein